MPITLSKYISANADLCHGRRTTSVELLRTEERSCICGRASEWQMRLRRPRGAMENPLKEHLSQLYCAPRQACPPHQRHYNCRPDPETRYQLTQPTITHENSKVGGNPEDPQAAAKATQGPASSTEAASDFLAPRPSCGVSPCASAWWLHFC